MTMLSKYYVPGLAIEDHSIDVPLDWTGHEPGRAFDGETIKLFYRVVTTPASMFRSTGPATSPGGRSTGKPSNCSIAWSPRPNMCMTTCRC